MNRPAVLAFLLAAVVVLGLSTPPPQAAADGGGTVIVTINAPSGVPANVVLTSSGYAGSQRLVATKPPTAATTNTRTFTAPADGYIVDARRVIWDGIPYVATNPPTYISVKNGTTTAITVDYTAEPGSRKLHANNIQSDLVALGWEGTSGATYVLRRTVGTSPAPVPTAGTDVPVRGTLALDFYRRPNTTYSYALFTTIGGITYGPLTVIAKTGPNVLVPPTTLLLRDIDVVSTATTATGVQVLLKSYVAPPLLGAGVVLPVSAALPGGYLGVVAAMSPNGRTLSLRAGALTDAVDYFYYDQTFPSFPIAAPQPQPTATCESSGTKKVSFSADVVLGGRLRIQAVSSDTYPVGVSAGLSLDVDAAADIDVDAAYSCSITLPKIHGQVTLDPVPIAVEFTPTATFSMPGRVKISHVGLSSHFGPGGLGTSDNASPRDIQVYSFLLAPYGVALKTPTISANGVMHLQLGGDLLLGPGVGSENPGIGFLRGRIVPIDASFSPVFGPTDSRYNSCLSTSVRAEASFTVTPKGFYRQWTGLEQIDANPPNPTVAYDGSPFDLPSGCRSSQPA